MNETENQTMDDSSTPQTLAATPSPKAMMALGRAFNQVGDKRNLPQFKQAGRGLIVAANKSQFSMPKVGDQRRQRTAKEAPIKPNKVM